MKVHTVAAIAILTSPALANAQTAERDQIVVYGRQIEQVGTAMRQCEDWYGRLQAFLAVSRKAKIAPESAANVSLA